MAEFPASKQKDIDPSNPDYFRAEVQARGLPYVLEGYAPQEPDDFDFILSIPQDEWQEVTGKIDQKIIDSDHFASLYSRLQQTLYLGEGRVGSVWVNALETDDGTPAISINRIQSDNRYLPEDSPYYNARGVGGAVLDGLCALADVRGWAIYLEALSHGAMSDYELVSWYGRHGFKFDFESENESIQWADDHFGMRRLPQLPDNSQSITNTFQHDEHNNL